jgi:hypothetical protein
MKSDETQTIAEYRQEAGPGSQPGGESEIEKLAAQGADLLALFQQNYEVVFKVLRDERNMRQGRKRAAHNESEIEYWQGRIDNAQAGIDALIRMKDIGKIGLMRERVNLAEYEQLTLIDGPMGPGKMGF